MKYKNLLISAMAAACGAACTTVAVSDLSLKTTKYTLKADVTESIKLAVLSDLHFAYFGKDNKRLIDAVRKISPDVILLCGDFFDTHLGKENTERVLGTLSQLSKIAPSYMSPGNHDMRFNIETGKDFKALAESHGVTVFCGEYTDLEIKNQKLRIGGIFDHSVYLEDYGKRWYTSPVYEFLKDFEETDRIKLLMMHRPNTFIYTNDKWNINAVFCGHDHGGIWRLPVIGGVYAPEQGFFPKYDKGEYDFGKMKMFLSAGLEGYYIVPRLFNRPEILDVTIR